MRANILITTAFTAAMSLALLAQGPPAGGGQGRGAGRGPQTPPLIMTSSAWEDGGVIPDKYTQAAGATAPNPALSWSQVPMGTQSFVLIMNDPEPVQRGSATADITHWIVAKIPATVTSIAEGAGGPMPTLPAGAKQTVAYRGPGAGAAAQVGGCCRSTPVASRSVSQSRFLGTQAWNAKQSARAVSDHSARSSRANGRS